MSKKELIEVIGSIGFDWNMTNECCLCQEKYIVEKLGKDGLVEVSQRFIDWQKEFYEKQMPDLFEETEKEKQIRESSQGAEQ